MALSIGPSPGPLPAPRPEELRKLSPNQQLGKWKEAGDHLDTMVFWSCTSDGLIGVGERHLEAKGMFPVSQRMLRQGLQSWRENKL